jgi:cysteine desulfurase
MIYLDSNATTQLDPAVLDAMLPFLREHYANPSASYASSGVVRKALQSAREALADLLSASPGEILFTSGGTESNNAAIDSAKMLWPRRKHLVIASSEHSAVTEPARRWEAEGGEVTRVPVDRQGLVNLDTLRHALRPDQTALVSIMWANNETGTIAPMAEIADIAHAAGALLHTDAVQAVGKLSINLQQTPIDYLSLSGHKFHAPKGIGALFVSRRARFRPFMLGGGQEEGRRSGTENVPAIVGLGKAASLMQQALHDGTEGKVKALRDAFEQRVFRSVAGVSVNGHPAHRLGTTASLCFSGINAQSMLIMLDQRSICCSAGSACHSANVHPSHVLEAMGYDAEHAASTLRFSFSRFNTTREVEASAEAIASVAAKLRAMRDDSAGPVIVAS